MSFPTGFDPKYWHVCLPLWAVGLDRGALQRACVLAFNRTGASVWSILAPAALVLVGAGVSLFFVDGGPRATCQHSAGRRRARARMFVVRARCRIRRSHALTPMRAKRGGFLRMSLFATPESVAAAMSYVSAQLLLLWILTDHARRLAAGTAGDCQFCAGRSRRIVSARCQLLTVRDGCIPNDCVALASLHDPGRIGTNLAEGPLISLWRFTSGLGPRAVQRPATAAAVASSPGTGHLRDPRWRALRRSYKDRHRTPPGELFFSFVVINSARQHHEC